MAAAFSNFIGKLRAALRDSDLLAFNLRNRDSWIAARAAELPRGSRVIDVGAGSAPYRALFAHCDYKAQDFAQLNDDQLRDGAYGAIDYVGDATAIPVADGAFDAVLCSEVLEHHPEPIAVVRELARILAPGGRLMLTAPLGSGIHQEPYHYYGGYTPYWYQRFLSAAGFGSITVEPNGGSLRHFSQEAIRFMQMTRPFGAMVPFLVSVLWAPIWFLLLPVLCLVVPLSAKLLDLFDKEQRFTVGYHVRAVRK